MEWPRICRYLQQRQYCLALYNDMRFRAECFQEGGRKDGHLHGTEKRCVREEAVSIGGGCTESAVFKWDSEQESWERAVIAQAQWDNYKKNQKNKQKKQNDIYFTQTQKASLALRNPSTLIWKPWPCFYNCIRIALLSDFSFIMWVPGNCIKLGNKIRCWAHWRKHSGESFHKVPHLSKPDFLCSLLTERSTTRSTVIMMRGLSLPEVGCGVGKRGARTRGAPGWRPALGVNCCAEGCSQKSFNHHSGGWHWISTGKGHWISISFFYLFLSCLFSFFFFALLLSTLFWFLFPKLMFSGLTLHNFFINILQMMDDGYLWKEVLECHTVLHKSEQKWFCPPKISITLLEEDAFWKNG